MLETIQDCTIHTIDSNWLELPRYTAVYVLQGPDGLVLIETGAYCANGNVVAGLDDLGFAPSDIRHVLVSHIHLDHAGAAWWWARQGAQIYVHEFGAKHLVNPAALLNSATRIYGDRMDYLWGDVEPIEQNRVTSVHDGDVLEVGGLHITAIETPGHARHHHAYALTTREHGKICFTGDVGAMVMPEGDFIAVPTPPPEFDLDVWLDSLAKLESHEFDAIFPTHFGKFENPNAHFQRLARALQAHADRVDNLMSNGASRDEVYADIVGWQRELSLELGTPEKLYQDYAVDHLMDMNVSGLIRHWTKKQESPSNV